MHFPSSTMGWLSSALICCQSPLPLSIVYSLFTLSVPPYILSVLPLTNCPSALLHTVNPLLLHIVRPPLLHTVHPPLLHTVHPPLLHTVCPPSYILSIPTLTYCSSPYWRAQILGLTNAQTHNRIRVTSRGGAHLKIRPTYPWFIWDF